MAIKLYYTKEEAMQKLGVGKTTFYEYVHDGHIHTYLPPNKKRGAFFLAKDVDDLAAALKGFVKLYGEDKETTVLRPARPEDAQGMFELGESIMSRSGGYGIPVDRLLPFLSSPNSEIGHVLIRDNHIIGYFTIVPFKHEKLLQVMRRESRVESKNTATFEPGGPIDCFIWEIMSDPNQKHIGQYLIGRIFSFFHSLGKRGIEIEGIYAAATSPEGINLCRRIGMQMMDLPEVIQPNWIPFEWKIQEQKNWLTKNYIQAIKSYKKRQQRMQKGVDAPAISSDNT